MIKKILVISLAFIMSSCGFHFPAKENIINTTIVADTNNEFATQIEEVFADYIGEKARYLIIKIGNENKTKRAISYNSNGDVKQYIFSFKVAVKVFDDNDKLLLDKDLTASTYNYLTDFIQANRLQEKQIYIDLRNQVIENFLITIKYLSEN
jgi:outer membrane lipopolysaccharide assembly protein LptE/RlpB